MQKGTILFTKCLTCCNKDRPFEWCEKHDPKTERVDGGKRLIITECKGYQREQPKEKAA